MLNLTPSTITRLIDKLERKKYVEKQPEGKNIYLRTTAEGLAQQEQIVASWRLLHNQYRNILTEAETLCFLELSGKLLDKLGNKTE